jgi:surface protein
MFADCDTLTSLNLSGFKADSLKDMAGMFAGCRSLTSLDLSGFNTANVKYMGYAFSGCKSLTSLDLSGMITSSATEMEYMFQGCDTLASLDLSRFNTSRVWSMAGMFAGCKNLETIYAGRGWVTGAVNESSDMFNGCTKLVGGQGTVYDADYVDATRAHIDGGPNNPGYLTGKIIIVPGDVNADGELNIADVNCITSVILGDPDTYEGRADVNGDGEVTIADINAVLACILL